MGLASWAAGRGSAAVEAGEASLPIGKAKVMREGTDVTITAVSKMVGVCLQAAEALAAKGISAEVINLRTVRPLDRETRGGEERERGGRGRGESFNLLF